jgi:hypothetical protein
VRFTVSKSRQTTSIGFEAPSLEVALKMAADLMKGKHAFEEVRIFDAEQERYYDEAQILELLHRDLHT